MVRWLVRVWRFENMVDDERYLAVELEGLGADVRGPSVLHHFLK